MSIILRYFIRLFAMLAIVAATLFLPQQLAWGAPQLRTLQVQVEAGETVKVGFPATHVAVEWEGDASADIQLRGRNGEDVWSDWRSAPSDEIGEGHQHGMALMDDAYDVQVRVASGRATEIELMVMDTVHGPRTLELKSTTPKADALNGFTGQPPIIGRSQWGADENLRKGTPEFANVNKIVIHHTVTSNSDPNPAATVRAIYAYHTEGNGWNDVGYNYLVDAQGRIYEGRHAGGPVPGENAAKQGVIGAHAVNHNSGSVGISMLGDFTSVAPTAAQLTAVEQLVAWKADRYNLDIQGAGVVVGHRDVGQTSCPGNVAYTKLDEIRTQANMIKTLSYPPGNTPGYWVAAKNGAVFPYGSAQNFGSMAGKHLNSPIASMTRTANGQGYWLMGTDGGIFSFGNAQFFGSMGGARLNKPVVGLAPTPSGQGYWLVASDGGIFAFGDAKFHGSMGGTPLNQPVVGMSATPTGQGYWLVASDGGVFAFGDAKFFGSMGSTKLNLPVMTIATRPGGDGYWMMARDGGVFAFGTAPFRGSIPMLKLSAFGGAVQAVATGSGDGYYMLAANGGIYSFGDARFHGAPTDQSQAVSMALVP